MSKAVTHMANISRNDMWETPQPVYEKGCLLARFNPKLDVCATHETAKCSNYFGPDQTLALLRDGLNNKVRWKMNFFMNPPYSQVAKWIEKAIVEAQNNEVKGLILTYAKTDTQWWHKYIEGSKRIDVHFIKGRINFLMDGTKSKYSAPYPSVWLVIK